MDSDSNFKTDRLAAKIQGLSIQIGELFSELYSNNVGAVWHGRDEHALEAYRSLRRCLPTVTDIPPTDTRHIGHAAAHKSTQRRQWRQTLFPV